VGQSSVSAGQQTEPSNEKDEPTSGASSTTALSPVGLQSTLDSYLLRQMEERGATAEAAQNLRMHDMLPIIKEASADLRQVCGEAVACVKIALDSVNDRRWHSDTEEDERIQRDLQKSVDQLSTALGEFKDTKRQAFVDPYMDIIKQARTPKEQEALPLRFLYLSLVFAANLIVFATGILAFMELVKDTMAKRKDNRIWAPKGLRTLGKLLLAKGDKRDRAFGDDAAPTTDDVEESTESYREL
jgi:hypothetical protein